MCTEAYYSLFQIWHDRFGWTSQHFRIGSALPEDLNLIDRTHIRCFPDEVKWPVTSLKEDLTPLSSIGTSIHIHIHISMHIKK